jgi:hypothetical protein
LHGPRLPSWWNDVVMLNISPWWEPWAMQLV